MFFGGLGVGLNCKGARFQSGTNSKERAAGQGSEGRPCQEGIRLRNGAPGHVTGTWKTRKNAVTLPSRKGGPEWSCVGVNLALPQIIRQRLHESCSTRGNPALV